MTDDYVQTLVMDIKPATSTNASAAEVAEKIQATIDEQKDIAQEANFTRTYSYLT